MGVFMAEADPFDEADKIFNELAEENEEALARRTSPDALEKDKRLINEGLNSAGKAVPEEIAGTLSVTVANKQYVMKESTPTEINMAEVIANGMAYTLDADRKYAPYIDQAMVASQAEYDTFKAQQKAERLASYGFTESSPDNQLSIEFSNKGQVRIFIGHIEGDNLILDKIQSKDGSFKNLNNAVPAVPLYELGLKDVNGKEGLQSGSTKNTDILNSVLKVSQLQNALDNGTKFAMNPSIPKLASTNQQVWRG